MKSATQVSRSSRCPSRELPIPTPSPPVSPNQPPSHHFLHSMKFRLKSKTSSLGLCCHLMASLFCFFFFFFSGKKKKKKKKKS